MGLRHEPGIIEMEIIEECENQVPFCYVCQQSKYKVVYFPEFDFSICEDCVNRVKIEIDGGTVFNKMCEVVRIWRGGFH